MSLGKEKLMKTASIAIIAVSAWILFLYVPRIAQAEYPDFYQNYLNYYNEQAQDRWLHHLANQYKGKKGSNQNAQRTGGRMNSRHSYIHYRAPKVGHRYGGVQNGPRYPRVRNGPRYLGVRNGPAFPRPQNGAPFRAPRNGTTFQPPR